ncbi:MAG: alkaline phosphatase family protein [Chloroflexi bacterium]|nr:alkaline phosphatase family protein [Chloroflexota bacterium]MBI3339832.1 alkaline phosphatase family protein [Chloroflexota bacterium]
MAELILGPLIGGLSHNSVNLWGRADAASALYAWIATLPDLSDSYLAGQADLNYASGFAGIVPIKKLKPETTYYFALSLEDKQPAKETFRFFKTSPKPGQIRSFRFAFGSCFRLDNDHPGQAFRHILDHQKDLSFLMMLGDQVYADEWKHNGIGRVAVTRDEYRQVYLNTWSDPDLRELLANVPVYMTLDDHEVDNDWHWENLARDTAVVPWYTRLIRRFGGRPLAERRIPRQRIRDALQAYWEHQGIHAPKMLLPMERDKDTGDFNLMEEDAGSLAYTFYYGPAAFFVMDTRTMRVHNRDTQIVLGEAQWKVLKEWLMDVKDTYPVKFLVSSSAFLFEMFGDIANDRWSGFPKERDQLLYFLAEQGIEGVYILAGDLHEAHAISAQLSGPDGKDIPIWEFCATPFKQEINWLAKLLIIEPSSAALKNARVHFSIGKINYGVVEVELDKSGNQKVTYIVNYKDKEWMTRSISSKG